MTSPSKSCKSSKQGLPLKSKEQSSTWTLERLLSKVPWSELSDSLSKKYTGQLSNLRSLVDDSNYSLLWTKMANFKALAIF